MIKIICNFCKGTGKIEYYSMTMSKLYVKCIACDGVGYICHDYRIIEED